MCEFLISLLVRFLCPKASRFSPIVLSVLLCSFTSVWSGGGEWSCIAVTQHVFFWQCDGPPNPKKNHIKYESSFSSSHFIAPSKVTSTRHLKLLVVGKLGKRLFCGHRCQYCMHVETSSKEKSIKKYRGTMMHFCPLCDQYWKHYHLFKNKKVFSLLSYSAMQTSVMLNIPHLNSSVNLVCR